jgi:Zn-dependent M16 (insulinase) family peptidase
MGAPAHSLAPGARLHGFVVADVQCIADLRATVLRFEHGATGAQAIHILNDDPENLFSVTFATPPPDDTGMPHILEHAVLAGSKRYPIREPFYELVKMSMATFINAATGYDCTYYPVCSLVPRDLFNLADVYFDAVFHPLLTDLTLMREGHHLAPADPSKPTGDLSLSGVVFNEMKGMWSNPEAKLGRLAVRRLLPDTIYGNESGGTPEAIPDLKWSDLRAFHRAHYHPSNARFVFYGNIASEDYLAFLGPRLEGFDRQARVTPAVRQPRWPAPRVMEDTYAVEPGEALDGKTFVCLQWLTGDVLDPVDDVLEHVLSMVLLGNEAAPLRKALIDSHLGHDLVMSGDSVVGFETTFHVGLKGSEPDRAQAFLDRVTSTLRDLAGRGIPRDRIEAAFQQATYYYREVLPEFPLHVLDRVLSTWLYDADPLLYLRLGEHLAAARDRWQRDPDAFSRMIRSRLLDNPHRLLLVLRPDPAAQRVADDAFRTRMRGARAALTDEEAAAVARHAAEVEESAGTPNSPEELARLPQLRVADLPDAPQRIPTAAESLADGTTWLRNDVFSNGVNYLHLNFDLRGLPADLWPLIPRYAEAIGKMGAAAFSFEEMAHRLAASTGGIRCSTDLRTRADDPDRPVWSLRLSLRSLDEQVGAALDVLRDLVFAVNPRNRERLRDVLVQARARYRNDLVNHGHTTAMVHASRGLSPEGHLTDQMGGLPQLARIESLAGEFDVRSEAVMSGIERIRDFLLARARVTASFTGSDAAAGVARDAVAEWLGRMRSDSIVEAPVGFQPFERPPCEGLSAPTQVAYACMVLPAPHLSDADEALITLGTQLLEFDYYLPEVRFKGNAYGVYCMFDPYGRRLTLLSYRDPEPGRSLDVFAATPDFIRGAAWSEADLHRTIIATAKNDFLPLRPGEVTGLALQRHLTGYTPERQAARYRRLKAATVSEVRRALLACFTTGLARAATCVVAGGETLDRVNHSRPDHPLAIRAIRK